MPGKYDKEHVGVYMVVESVDKNFLKLHYKNNTGLLMKPERLRGLDHLGDDWARYKDTYQPKRDATKDESKRVIDFTKLVNTAPDAQFNKEIASYLDVDAFLTFMAATAIVSNLDSFFTHRPQLLPVPAPRNEQVPLHPVGRGPVAGQLPDLRHARSSRWT